jgi:hypothetical protein
MPKLEDIIPDVEVLLALEPPELAGTPESRILFAAQFMQLAREAAFNWGKAL